MRSSPELQRRRVLPFTALLVLALGSPALSAPVPGLPVQPSTVSQEAPPQPDTPWGYLWVFRTMRSYALRGDEARIGRLAENDVVLTSPMVSRRHAVIRRDEAGVYLIDVGSSNGSRLDTRKLRPRFPVPLQPGGRIQLADELLLYQPTLPELWRDELRHRLLSGFVKLRVDMPQDTTRRSFGREETVNNVTEARVRTEDAKVDIAHSNPLEPQSGFPAETIAMIANVIVDDGVMELSLWSLASAGTMTSRRSSLANLKHTTLKISVDDDALNGVEAGGAKGPWFPNEILSGLFELYPDDPDGVLQFGTSLTEQDRAIALRDAAETLAFRHRIDPAEWRLLLLAARARASFVEREVAERSALLTPPEKTALADGLAESRLWLERARELGAEEDWTEDAVAAMSRAEERLKRLLDQDRGR